MRVLILTALAALLAACSGESVSSLRDPAIKACAAQLDEKDSAKFTGFCACIVDATIASSPEADALISLKVIVANPKSEEEAAKAAGLSADEAKVFFEKQQKALVGKTDHCKL